MLYSPVRKWAPLSAGTLIRCAQRPVPFVCFIPTRRIQTVETHPTGTDWGSRLFQGRLTFKRPVPLSGDLLDLNRARVSLREPPTPLSTAQVIRSLFWYTVPILTDSSLTAHYPAFGLRSVPPPAALPPALYKDWARLLMAVYQMNLDLAWSRYDQLVRDAGGPFLSESLFHSLLRLIIRFFQHEPVKSGFRLSQAWAIIQDFRATGRPFTQPSSYHVLIQILVLSNQPEAARHVLQAMLEQGLPLTAETFRAFIMVPGIKDEHYVMRIFETFVELGVTPTVPIYETMAFLAGRNGNLQLFTWLLQDMDKRGLTPSPNVYAAHIQMLTRRHFRRMAYEKLLQYFSSQHFQPIEQNSASLRSRRRGTGSNLFIYIVRNYLHSAPPHWVLNILDLMKDYEIEVYEPMLAKLIIRFVDRQDYQNAMKFYQLALDRGVTLRPQCRRYLARLFMVFDSFELGWELFTQSDLAYQYQFTNPETPPALDDRHLPTDPGAPTKPSALYIPPDTQTQISLDTPTITSLVPLFYSHQQYRAVTVLVKHIWSKGFNLRTPLPTQMVASYIALGKKTEALLWYRRFLNNRINIDIGIVDQLGV
ncbi:hypothetical protein H4R33_000751 [Dimargaris cristalligena]|uniref:Pentacotripeptide-repeat region of PRORP domain-containing protein n=1 Tax=Dimargaris cristalligena TaxID=215637 RepID=A0A4P9ZXW5_9FUNG|nr:hypothetical protein H4R33_000751 [Dimargaris cristalligena]RKP38565.1 hypothetical protein BJ085DRAFT_27563 [Dimargaris cristalligena]|eukprot:RKP38565.1 hypothetical protein BJ085DRAFT_27563 [Dimargaris cristalligena]